MTTDDLRTRAREAAEERYPQEPDRGLTYPREAIRQGKAAAFIDGTLWHAAQQPTRYQIAEVLWNRANRWEPAMMPFDEVCSVEREHWMKDADAVLALWDGAGS